MGLFNANKLSLNIRKAKDSLFHKKSSKDGLLSYQLKKTSYQGKLPTSKTADNTIERKASIKFLGLMLDENVFWGKLAKILDYCTVPSLYLKEKYLKSIYFAYIHSCMNYAKIV